VASGLRIIVAGMVAGDPYHGGASWAVLQYVLGLERLGHDVVLVEPVRRVTPDIARYFRQIVGEFRLEDRAALLDAGGETMGLPYPALRAAAQRAHLLVNISGLLRDPALTEPIPRRVYLDLDPAFTQLWHAVEAIDMGFDLHTHHASLGTALGQDSCPVPTCAIDWIPTLPPVVLDHWPVADAISHDAFTTVGNWRAYGSVEHEGVVYGQKAHSLRRLVRLPTLTSERFVLALAIHPDEVDDLAELRRNRWQIVDPGEVAGTPADYRRFVQGSKAEFGLAKSGYASARCGWFSDRSACYLASGRPVLAQDCGFGNALPVGAGLLAFTGVDDALAGIEELRRDYSKHARAARALVEEWLESDRVLTRLLEAVGAA
jgi:hypothetical protein